MTKETFENLTMVLASDEIQEMIDNCESTEAFVELLKEKGIEVSAEELKTYFEGVARLEAEDDALSENELEMVAGGGAIWDWIKGKVKQIKNDFKKIIDSFTYFVGGGWVSDVASGKKKHPWVN